MGWGKSRYWRLETPLGRAGWEAGHGLPLGAMAAWAAPPNPHPHTHTCAGTKRRTAGALA